MSIRRIRREFRGAGESKWPDRLALVVIAIGIASGLAVAVYRLREHDAIAVWRARLEEEAGHPAWPAWRSFMPALPDPPRRRHEVTQDLHGVYAYAALRRDLLQDIPCFCGCVREGHRSVLNCFVERVERDGRPVWTNHAFDCELCVHIVRETMLMESLGLTRDRIRAAIERRYSQAHLPTAKPLPVEAARVSSRRALVLKAEAGLHAH